MRAALAFNSPIFERTTLLTYCHVFVFHSLHTSPQSVHIHVSVASVCIAHLQHIITVQYARRGHDFLIFFTQGRPRPTVMSLLLANWPQLRAE